MTNYFAVVRSFRFFRNFFTAFNLKSAPSRLSMSVHGTSTMILSFPAWRWTLAGTSLRCLTRLCFLVFFVAIPVVTPFKRTLHAEVIRQQITDSRAKLLIAMPELHGRIDLLLLHGFTEKGLHDLNLFRVFLFDEPRDGRIKLTIENRPSGKSSALGIAER